MRFTREAVQESVDKYSSLIREHLQIPLEEIIVEEKEFVWPWRKNTIMTTIYGKIFIDPTKEYDYHFVNQEESVLHEIGHRSVEALCPRFNIIIPRGCNTCSSFLRVLNSIVTGNAGRDVALSEGIAECFALDVFPSYFLLDSNTLYFMQETKDHHQKNLSLVNNPAGFGRPFFRMLYNGMGLQGLCSYIRNLTPEQVPSKEDLRNPVLYWGRYSKQLPQSDVVSLPQHTH